MLDLKFITFYLIRKIHNFADFLLVSDLGESPAISVVRKNLYFRFRWIFKIRKGSHTASRLTCHIVWPTKYRYKVLRGDIQIRCRELLIQICEAESIEILKGIVSADHIHREVLQLFEILHYCMAIFANVCYNIQIMGYKD